ncbi:MAG TPA: hypothetical protein VH681_01460 [Nitrospiraceae bacterium]
MVLYRSHPIRWSSCATYYGSGLIKFSGTSDALYEVKRATPREQFEAAARSIRDSEGIWNVKPCPIP